MVKQYIWSIIITFLPMILLAQGENWVYRYNGPGNYHDIANSVVYGADGNIYAAGYSDGNGTYSDFTVISLTTIGDTNWVYRYNGPGNGDDYAKSVVYGADGNIYAAGTSDGNGTYSDFTVISLTTIGDTNWVYRYNGPGNHYDNANSVVYGADGNIYAAGLSNSDSTGDDFTVVSLTTAGDTNWVYRYDGPEDINDDATSIIYGSDGNIYAAGYSDRDSAGQDPDFTVVSLTTAGDTNWVYRYNSPGNGDDCANSLVYGADGNIYAAGFSNSYFTVVSLTITGDTNWVYMMSNLGISYAYSLVYGSDDNIYVAGNCNVNASLSDFTVVSLTTAGDTNWVYRYNGPGYRLDNALTISYGADNNIYAAGCIFDSITFGNLAVVSLTTAGDANWVYRYCGSAGMGGNQANSVVYGADGNIYAAGFSYNSGTEYDFTIISLDPDYAVDEENSFVKKNCFGTTIFSGPLRLPKGKTCKVFDITGRTVMPDKIRPGIYFIQVDGKIIQKVIKVR